MPTRSPIAVVLVGIVLLFVFTVLIAKLGGVDDDDDDSYYGGGGGHGSFGGYSGGK